MLIKKPDTLLKKRTDNAVRLLYLPDAEIEICATDDSECGVYNLVALGLTAADVARMRFLLRLPFRLSPWPFTDDYCRQEFANLYVKISPDDIYG